MHPRFRTFLPFGALLLIPFAGCDAVTSDGPDGPKGQTRLAVQLIGQSAARGGAGVTLTEVKFLLNSIHLNAGSGDDDAPETEVEFEDANLVVSVDPTGAATPVTLRDVPEGTYSRVTFQIHKPEDAEAIPDPDFRDGSSGNQRYSTILRGTVDGQPFTLKVRDGMQQRLTLSPPLTVGDSTAAVTLQTDVSGWFVDEDGDPLDPRDEDDADEIADRIEDSFHARGR